ncbi:TPA: hypothetical protein NIB55_005863 [Pseudomonas aeruginosa]|uniref:hypothetical protein n=1 Tax=Stutzerimonas balearica TaxID=74829 RepID=UPI0019AE086E|nr:hypothetical protein [Stutzerimonas balearica]MBC7198223.1 hypothetical protein [Stutzerimonas balearica]HCF3018593.1 hypothetical protein [Pseudomonas aeruginosa]
MATLQECLQQLPGDMLMIDLPAPGHVVLTVAELLEKHQRVEHGYEIRDQKYNYGKNTLKVVGVVKGPAIFRQKV